MVACEPSVTRRGRAALLCGMANDQERQQYERAKPCEPPAPHVPSMHDDVAESSDDICVCEAEPRWAAVGEESERAAAAERDSKGET